MSEHERLLLVSKWSLMTGEKDYNEIQNTLSVSAKAAGITFP
jgi:hypothetical protein